MWDDGKFSWMLPILKPELEMGRFPTEVVPHPHRVPVLGALE